MTKIIKSGDKVPEKKPLTFKCPFCKCEFETDSYGTGYFEYIYESMGIPYSFPYYGAYGVCPRCNSYITKEIGINRE